MKKLSILFLSIFIWTSALGQRLTIVTFKSAPENIKEENKVYLEEFKESKTLQIIQKWNVVSMINIDQNGDVDTVSKKLMPYEYLRFSKWEEKLSFTALTIPFKIRSSIDTFPALVETKISNIGLFLGKSYSTTRYFFDGTSSKINFTGGVFLAPTAISLSSSNVKNDFDKEINQLGISTGVGVSFSFKNISLFAAFGSDIGLMSETQKNWIYQEKPWIGFGIGLDTSLLSFGK